MNNPDLERALAAIDAPHIRVRTDKGYKWYDEEVAGKWHSVEAILPEEKMPRRFHPSQIKEDYRNQHIIISYTEFDNAAFLRMANTSAENLPIPTVEKEHKILMAYCVFFIE